MVAEVPAEAVDAGTSATMGSVCTQRATARSAGLMDVGEAVAVADAGTFAAMGTVDIRRATVRSVAPMDAEVAAENVARTTRAALPACVYAVINAAACV